MSATCPNNPPKRVDVSDTVSSGFTLLELVVVLTLVSLMTMMAVPNLQRLYGAAARTTERNEILDRFADLGRQAMLHRRAYLVVGAPAPDEREDEVKTADAAARFDDEHAPFSAYVASFEHHEPYRIDLPAGWTLHLPEPIFVRANGVCLGGKVELSYNGEPDVRLVLNPPYCHVDPRA